MSEADDFTENETPLLQHGDDFHGYVVERLIGKGGLGTVWLVRHKVLDTLFAIKVLNPALVDEKPEYVKRFVREAKLATKIRHPNLVAVHDAGYDPEKNVYYLVMDYVKGDTLREVIAFGGAMPEKEAVQIVLQVADVLAAAQCFGMVHRDLKPENIMLTKDGVVKLLDLGVAKISDGIDSLKTSANAVFGTPAYISPEQALDASTVDTRADVYSLGIILFELLTGHRPYQNKPVTNMLRRILDPTPIPDVRTANSAVSPKLSAALSLMCAKRLEDRLESPKAVIETFARLGYALPVASGTEFAAETDRKEDGGPSIVDIIAGLPTKPTKQDLPTLVTQDVDLREFVLRLKKKKRKRLLMFVAVASLLLAAVVVLVLVLC